MVAIHDTLSGARKELVPLGDEVTMYVCGVTPYAEAHAGHALHAIVFDVARRYLEWRGYRVKHIQNFTDIDDKLIDRAGRLGVPVADLAERHSQEYMDYLQRLNVMEATIYPRATEEIPRIIEIIRGLEAKEFAYESAGDVYFRVRRRPDYGKLSKRAIDDLKAGARVDPGEKKEDPLDFALWKAAKPGEPSWPSPWGPGRPGWHIECSAMAIGALGERIDIHGGGADLIFPHHENEIAQSESYTGKEPFAAIWMHNALLQLGEEKMSKSLGNLVTLSEALEAYGPDALRLFVLTTHYRTPLTYTEEGLKAARAGVDRLRGALMAGPRAVAPTGELGTTIDPQPHRERFIAAMDDDFNTPQALAVLFALAREINRARDEGRDTASGLALFRELAGVLGLTLADPGRDSQEATPFIDLLVELRTRLRAEKQWALADELRGRLTALGVELHDSPEGTTWKAR